MDREAKHLPYLHMFRKPICFKRTFYINEQKNQQKNETNVQPNARNY